MYTYYLKPSETAASGMSQEENSRELRDIPRNAGREIFLWDINRSQRLNTLLVYDDEIQRYSIYNDVLDVFNFFSFLSNLYMPTSFILG